MVRELDESASGAGLAAEEVDEDAFGRDGRLVDQDADGIARMQGAQDFAGRLPSCGRCGCRRGRAAFHPGVEAGIVERPAPRCAWARS